ncbi:hypothetical protein SGL43_04936 [Streptomyces globisporus]|uniref:Uncharacterized protein n=1 Tax=Streptomyces globisporus TaxID=1908 RepID=A0ABN8VA30_STRGL|nr:hypothetical protein SGL43_04936 [Streptomyces globisporus]
MSRQVPSGGSRCASPREVPPERSRCASREVPPERSRCALIRHAPLPGPIPPARSARPSSAIVSRAGPPARDEGGPPKASAPST